MREGWRKATLAEVCLIKPPKKEAKQRLNSSDLVSFIPMNDLGERTKCLSLNNERPLGDVIGSYTYFADNDVLLAKITPCFENGKLGIARNLTNGVGFGSSEYIVYRSKGEIDPEYLFYFLSQDSFRDAGARVMTGAVGHKRVPKEFVENYEIPLPPLPEQKHIVAILDEAFEGIAAAAANAEKNLANARELFESYLNAVFTQTGEGRERVRISEVCDSIVDCVNRTAPQVEEPTDFKMIRTTNVRHGRINLKNVKFVTEETFRTWTRRQLPKRGDVIVTREAPMGEVGIIDSDDQIFLGQRLVSYRADKERLVNEFLLYALQSNDLQGQIHSLASGSTVQHMRVPDSKNLMVSVPPVNEQKVLVKNLKFISTQCENLKDHYNKKLSFLDHLKQSILQEAFSGEITAQSKQVLKEAVA